jgi:hypothetical protein
MVRFVDDISINGRAVDILEHVNQARSRDNLILKLQQTAEQAIKSGRIGSEEFGPLVNIHGQISLHDIKSRLSTSVKDGDLEKAFLETIDRHLIQPLKKLSSEQSSVTVEGATQLFTGGLERMSDDWFVTGNHNDLFTNFSPAEINNRSISKTKITGRVANALEQMMGEEVVGIGSQFIMATMGEQLAKTVSARVVGQATAETVTSAEVLAASRKMMHLGRSSAQGALDVFRDEAGL